MGDINKPFLFFSYSHSDSTKIVEIKDTIMQMGYNVVFDESINYGDNWEKQVKTIFKNQNCFGIMVLLSKASMSSENVLKELEMIKIYDKQFFVISLENSSTAEILQTINDKKRRETAIECISFIPDEIKYINAKEMLPENKTFIKTLDDFGLVPDLSITKNNYVLEKYTTELPDEHNRLNRQQAGYLSFDCDVLFPLLEKFNRTNLVVIDLGCSTGAVDFSRFNSDNRVAKVIGFDFNSKDIEIAKAANYGDKFKFYQIDLESENVIVEIKNILKENAVESIDLIFSCLTIHHLKNPQNLLLKLFDLMSSDGKIFLRGSDDGAKLCYPESELLSEFLERYAKIFGGVNDRKNGRKLYKLLCDTGYVNIKMNYAVVDTCEKTRNEKQSLFEVGFGFRKARLEKLLSDNQNNKQLIEEIKWQQQAITKIEELFAQRDFWYSNTSFIATAEVK